MYRIQQIKMAINHTEEEFRKEIASELKISEDKIDSLIQNLINFYLPITGTQSWKYAQVTGGGVTVEEVNPETMESKIVPHLYFAGEILDVDGDCGGYNLQWAWSSGYLAGKSAADRWQGWCPSPSAIPC